MLTNKELLQELEIGNSVAETDDGLKKYFLQTNLFREFVRGKHDIIRGDKGTGKTAIFRIARDHGTEFSELAQILILPGFNETGAPVFRKFEETNAKSEAALLDLWKVYILTVVGNAILDRYSRESASTKALTTILEKWELRESGTNFVSLLKRAVNAISRFELTVGKKKLGIAFKDPTPQGSVAERVDAALLHAKQCLAESNEGIWLAFDRLDEAFIGKPEIELPALRALCRCYLDLQNIRPEIQLKLFIRKDLYRAHYGRWFCQFDSSTGQERRHRLGRWGSFFPVVPSHSAV